MLWAKISYHWPLLSNLPFSPSQVTKHGLLWVLSHILPLACTMTQQPRSSDRESRLAFPFAANFRNSFLKQMHTWQNITWDKLLSRGSQPFYPETPSLRARLKLWDTTFTENHDMALHKLGQEAVPKYASLVWLWPYGELHFPESKHWTQGLVYCKILCFSLCPLLQRLLKNLELH